MNNFICLTLHDNTPIILNKSHITEIWDNEGVTNITMTTDTEYESWEIKETIPEIMEMLEK